MQTFFIFLRRTFITYGNHAAGGFNFW